MTDPLTPEHLAELRRMADSPDWPQWGDDDVRELLDEIDRLQRGTKILAARVNSVRMLAYSLRQVTAFGATAHPDDEVWSVAAYSARQLLAALGPQVPQDAPQSGTAPPRDAPVMDFPSEPPTGPQEPAEPCAHCGKPRVGYGGINEAAVCHTGTVPAQAEPFDCYRLVTVYGEPLGARIAMDGRLYVNGPPCRHDATWLLATGAGFVCMVCGPCTRPQDGPTASTASERAIPDTDAPQAPQEPAQAVGYLLDFGYSEPMPFATQQEAIDHAQKGWNRPIQFVWQLGPQGLMLWLDGHPSEIAIRAVYAAHQTTGIAPEDEGIATADVLAQIAHDNESEPR
jgi:hypothetical protein